MNNASKEPKIGKHVFNTLTTGMYINPLDIYREYIQNSTDAIESAIRKGDILHGQGEININIDPDKKSIQIEDNGCGISKDEIEAKLMSIGASLKDGYLERGFRGIGRLGGMAYCDEIEFRTSTKGGKHISVNTWDCNKIKQILDSNSDKYRNYSFLQVVDECTTIRIEENDQKKSQSYFKVEMKNVSRSDEVLLNTTKVSEYISYVSPVPFDYQKFPFGKYLDDKFKKELTNYNTFKIFVNGVEIFKPYKTTLRCTKNKLDTVKRIIEFEIIDEKENKVVAKGWRGERKALDASILKTENVDGIRVRVGNILIGDADLLDHQFKEDRFNSYFIGEIHAVSPLLKPNARRDNFEDNEMKKNFLQSVNKQVGLELSKLVRETSSHRSAKKPIENAKSQLLQLKSRANKGFVGDAHRKSIIGELDDTKRELRGLLTKNKLSEDVKSEAKEYIERIAETVSDLKTNESYDIFNKIPSTYSKKEKEVIKQILDLIYSNFTKYNDPVKLIEFILNKI